MSNTNPFLSGDCLSCHDPHTSEQQTLLVSDGNNLCFNCHEDTSKMIRFPHAPVEGEGGLSGLPFTSLRGLCRTGE